MTMDNRFGLGSEIGVDVTEEGRRRERDGEAAEKAGREDENRVGPDDAEVSECESGSAAESDDLARRAREACGTRDTVGEADTGNNADDGGSQGGSGSGAEGNDKGRKTEEAGGDGEQGADATKNNKNKDESPDVNLLGQPSARGADNLPAPGTPFRIRVFFFGAWVIVVIDTGSAVSIMNEDRLRQGAGASAFAVNTEKYRSAAKSPIHVSCAAPAKVGLEGGELPWTMRGSPQLPWDLILFGGDFMTFWCVTVAYGRDKAGISVTAPGGEELRALRCDSGAKVVAEVCGIQPESEQEHLKPHRERTPQQARDILGHIVKGSRKQWSGVSGQQAERCTTVLFLGEGSTPGFADVVHHEVDGDYVPALAGELFTLRLKPGAERILESRGSGVRSASSPMEAAAEDEIAEGLQDARLWRPSRSRFRSRMWPIFKKDSTGRLVPRMGTPVRLGGGAASVSGMKVKAGAGAEAKERRILRADFRPGDSHASVTYHSDGSELPETDRIRVKAGRDGCPVLDPNHLLRSLVPKFRAVLDLRITNRVTEDDSYPQPFVWDILQWLATLEMYSEIDLFAYFHQFSCCDLSGDLMTAEVNRHPPMAPTRMRQGIKQGTAVGQRATDRTLLGLSDVARGFIDDIKIGTGGLDRAGISGADLDLLWRLVRRAWPKFATELEGFLPTIQAHFFALLATLRRMRGKLMTAGALKMKVFQHTLVNTFGWDVSLGSIVIAAIRRAVFGNYKHPTSVSEIRSFLGSGSYLRFNIANFTARTAALRDNIKTAGPGKKFQLTAAAKREFEDMRSDLAAGGIPLAPRRPHAPALLENDYCVDGMAGLAWQVYADPGAPEQVAAFQKATDSEGFLRALGPRKFRQMGLQVELFNIWAEACTEAQKKRDVRNGECDGLVKNLLRNRRYIWGARATGEVDHASVRMLMDICPSAARLGRLAIILSEFASSLRLFYVPGARKRKTTIDALSRCGGWATFLADGDDASGSSGAAADGDDEEMELMNILSVWADQPGGAESNEQPDTAADVSADVAGEWISLVLEEEEGLSGAVDGGIFGVRPDYDPVDDSLDTGASGPADSDADGDETRGDGSVGESLGSWAARAQIEARDGLIAELEASGLGDGVAGPERPPAERKPRVLTTAQWNILHDKIGHGNPKDPKGRLRTAVEGTVYDCPETWANLDKLKCNTCEAAAVAQPQTQFHFSTDTEADRVFGYKIGVDIGHVNYKDGVKDLLATAEYSQFVVSAVQLDSPDAKGVLRALDDRECNAVPPPVKAKLDQDPVFLSHAVLQAALQAADVLVELVNKDGHQALKAELALRHLKRLIRKLIRDEAEGRCPPFRSFRALLAMAVRTFNELAYRRVYGRITKVSEHDPTQLEVRQLDERQRDAARAAFWATRAERRLTRALKHRAPAGVDPLQVPPRTPIWYFKTNALRAGENVEGEAVGPWWQQGDDKPSALVISVNGKVFPANPTRVSLRTVA